MYFDFPTILVGLTLFTGLVWLIDALLLRRKRQQQSQEPWLIDISRSFFPVFLAVVVIRSFLIEPFRIPSGSMMPTLLVGDFILVNKFAYGLRLPVTETKILSLGEPQRGDVIVFRWPGDHHTDYIKRVIGVPGDQIAYHDKTIFLNGQPLVQTQVGTYQDSGTGSDQNGDLMNSERIGTVDHRMMINPNAPDFHPSCVEMENKTITVPPGHYFAMGDNRDHSSDGRCWGFVPESHLRGRAMAIWMNWDMQRSGIIDWSRIGQSIH